MKSFGLAGYDDEFLDLERARGFYAQGDTAHDMDHVLRVTRLGIEIAQAEGADVQVVRLAALLHDVPAGMDEGAHVRATGSADGNVGGKAVGGATGAVDLFAERAAERLDHHHAAAAFARSWLTARGMGTAQVDNVVHCIEAHRFRDRSIQPTTPEAKCLYDADKLDSIGAIGVVRAFAYAGANGARMWTQPVGAVPPLEDAPEGAAYTPVHEFVYKLQRVLSTLYTPTARRLAAERHAFMVGFFGQLDAEMQGLA